MKLNYFHCRILWYLVWHIRQTATQSQPGGSRNSVGYGAWSLTGWHHHFMIDWSRYRLGLPGVAMHYGFMQPVGIPTVFCKALTVPLHSPNGRQMPAIKAVQGDCERVYTSDVPARENVPREHSICHEPRRRTSVSPPDGNPLKAAAVAKKCVAYWYFFLFFHTDVAYVVKIHSQRHRIC